MVYDKLSNVTDIFTSLPSKILFTSQLPLPEHFFSSLLKLLNENSPTIEVPLPEDKTEREKTLSLLVQHGLIQDDFLQNLECDDADLEKFFRMFEGRSEELMEGVREFRETFAL